MAKAANASVQDFQLLTTKLNIPQTRPNLVPRPRLIERMNAGLHGKVTLISAPAGSGKTTLVSVWVEQCRGPVAWLSLDELDNEPRRFFAYLVAALQQVDADIGVTARAALETRESLSPVAIAATLINDLARAWDDARSPHIVLVLDDYHVIENPEVQEALRFAVDNQPPNLHLVITSRVDPGLALSQLRARGQVTEIREADLRFSQAETLEFLYTTVPSAVNLSPGDVHALAERTEGWIAGIQLATLSIQYQEDVSGFIQALSGGNEYILDYLTDEVLRGCSGLIKAFLLETSILDRLTGPLCDAVTRRDDSRRTLDALHEANLFLIALDDERRWYRYHHLFADALRVRLEQESPGEISELHRRASDWYAANGFVGEAIHHALAGEAFERGAELIEGFAEHLVFDVFAYVQVPNLLRWMDALPEALFAERPRLSVYRGWALANTAQSEADLQAVEACLGATQRALEDAPADDTVRGLLTALQAHLSLARGDTSRAVELTHAALGLVSADQHLFRAGLFNVLGTAYWLSGEVLKASQAYEESVRAADLCRNVFFKVGGLTGVAEMYKERGRLHQAAEYFRQAIQILTEHGWDSLPAAADLYVSLAEVLREWDRLEEALDYLGHGIEIGKRVGHNQLLIVAHIILARARYAQGEQAAALSAIQAAEAYARQYELMGLKSWAAAVHARLELAGGDLNAATRWARDAALDPDDRAASRRYPGEYATLARYLIARAEYARALGLLDRLHADAQGLGREGRVVEILALRAIALGLGGEPGGAQAALRTALELAEPEGFVRVFADEGQVMRDLLRQAARDDPANAYVQRLLRATQDAPHAADPNQTLVEPLSQRELEVLRLMAAGLKNREIADELVITLGTVKSHVNSIYGKLGVGSRVQAIERARALGILE
jgi:LuxR family maltose regulon positive regulatory protein